MTNYFFLVKTALLGWGIVIESVAFDVDNELIRVTYLNHGNKQQKIVSFQQIEELFTSDLSAAEKGPG